MALLNEEKEQLLPIHDEAIQLLRIIKTINARTKENSNWKRR